MTNEELCLRYRAGDLGAANELIENNIAFIRSFALDYHHGYRNVRLDADDYTQVGSLALLRAAERFDPAKGVRFLTYAGQAVRNAILDTIRTEHPKANIVPLGEECTTGTDDACLNRKRIIRQLRSTYETDPEHILIQKERLEEFYATIRALPPREKTWVIRRYGFDDDRYKPLAEMGRTFHLSISRAKQIDENAVVWLKKRFVHQSSCL